jgi:hypothetical protein
LHTLGKNEPAAIDLGPVAVDATGEILGNLAAH